MVNGYFNEDVSSLSMLDSKNNVVQDFFFSVQHSVYWKFLQICNKWMKGKLFSHTQWASHGFKRSLTLRPPLKCSQSCLPNSAKKPTTAKYSEDNHSFVWDLLGQITNLLQHANLYTSFYIHRATQRWVLLSALIHCFRCSKGLMKKYLLNCLP